MHIRSLVSPTRRIRPADASTRRAGRDEVRRAGRWFTVVSTVTTALLLAAAPALPAASAPHPYPDQDGTVAAQVDRFLTTRLQDSAIPGAAVALIRGDRVLMVRGYGHDSTDTPVTGDSLFRIASLSKSFTALAVMQLVDAGLVALDDPVRQHLPEFVMADPRADQVTVRELLNHTSGITDAVVPDLSRPQPSSPREAVTSLRSARLDTTPGTTYSYANPNYQVAARLVEVVSGEPFGEYLRRHIFEPAGMAATTSTATDDEPVPGLTEGHLIAYGHAFAAPAFGSYTTGDGGVVSSAADMARWLIVNAHGGRTADGTRIVSGHGMRLLHAPSAPGGYALGWDTRGPASAPATATTIARTRVEHSGSLFTFTSEAALWPASGYGVVLLFNSGSPMMLDQIAIAHGVLDIIEGTAPPTSGPHAAARIDTVLAVLTLAAVVLGACGVARAGRWVRRRRGTPLLAGLGMLPPVLVLVAGAAFPWLAEAWISRDVTWRAAAYEWPAVFVLVAAALVAAVSTLLARSWRWWRFDRADQPSADQPSADPTSADPTSAAPEAMARTERRAEIAVRHGRASPARPTARPQPTVSTSSTRRPTMSVQTHTARRRRTSAPTAPVTEGRRGAGATIVASIVAGALLALVLVLVVFPGATEAATTGMILLAFGFGWALMAFLTVRRTRQPQRWAYVPAVAMGATGAALVIFTPGNATMTALNWVWPPLLAPLAVWMFAQVRRSVTGAARWVLIPVISVLVLASVGATYANISLASDDVHDAAPGHLYDVGGHRMHLDCHGDGSPTVVLSNGLGGLTVGWARIAAPVAETTRVCAYDRAGQGWSDEADSPQDGVQSADDLHKLLTAAGEHGPYVLVGHSTGGTFAMTYTARYPDQVAGLVLLDGSSPEQFTRLPAFPGQYRWMMRPMYGVLPTLSRLGLGQLVPGGSTLPAADAAAVDAMTSAPKAYRSQRDEVSLLHEVFTQAQALTTFRDRPLAVLTASANSTGTDGWDAAQDKLAALSTNSVHRTIDSTHEGLLGDAGPAAESARAITEVVDSVRTGGSLGTP